MNTFFTCMKETCKKIKGYMNTAYSYMKNTLSYKDRALEAERKAELAQHRAENAKDIAISKANEVQGYVIPSNATYNKNEIDENNAAIWLAIWDNTQKINGIRLLDLN